MKRIIILMLLLITPVATKAGEVLRVGQAAPPFSLPDLFGRTISLSYFDGHPGAIVFWSTSNPRSVELLMELSGYQQRWGREDLAIVAVNADRSRPGASRLDAVRDYTDRLEIVFPVLLDSRRETLAAYGVSELPAAVVIDAGGRVSSILQGGAPTFREELKQNLLLALASPLPDAALPAAAVLAEPKSPARASVSPTASACTIPRSRSCNRFNERDPSASDPAVMAVRLCVCHGDADAAQIMLTTVNKESMLGPDLRFALANMMLLKGRAADARRAFESLSVHYPQLSWGEWGLGIAALADGDAEEALRHLRVALTGGWSIPEAETAVLKYLEKYWRTNTVAPREEQFLALFQDLNSVRDCYKQLNQRG
jgi:peroxiredoxin